jgi:DNA-binding transcriptional LysR family regulator
METPDVRQLRYFVAVAEELHFGRAAQRIGIAQPPLTQQIQKLEALLGCQVFIRGRKTALTAAGAVLLNEARRILSQFEHALDTTRRTARGETGHLTIGVPPSVMLSDLPVVIRRFRERYPNVGFALREMSTSAIEDAVRSGEIDLGMLRETKSARPLISEVIFTEAVLAVLPRSHKLAKRGPMNPGALRNEPFVLFPRRLGPALHDRLTGFCARAGFTPNVVQEATQWQTVISLVEAGMGVSLAPECVRKFRWRGVVYRPLPGATTSVAACWQENGLSPSAANFLKIAKANHRLITRAAQLVSEP